MTDDRYSFLGGENHLRLVLGAEGFWQERVKRTHGFEFHSHKSGIIWASFQPVEFLAGYPCVRAQLITSDHVRMVFFEAGNLTIFNKMKWLDVTGTRLDLL
jgi:hypothetical protein